MLQSKFADNSTSEAMLDVLQGEPGALTRDGSRPKQNWVLDRFQDTALIIVAPVITLALALLAIRIWGMAEGATIVLLVHVVFTVAHHLPTFIRIYGDVELFKRFNWHFIFAPLISFGIALGVCVYLNVHDYSLDNFLYLYIILTLWDPWHFMRQHYGFMRIYDRHNAAPRAVASRMDLALSSVWFAYIMLASGDWMLDLLQDVYTRVQWPMLLSITSYGLALATIALRDLALLVSGVYAAYLFWCWNKGYFVSMAKVLMCAVTFGVMYLTYTPNALMQSLAPGWSFKVGFAVIGVVHMTQYLAIVWRYNRGLAVRNGRARSGVFRWLHSRGAWWAAGLYVAVCLAYGDVITTVHNNSWLMSALLALGFTSTMMHYYFDGFIWRVRDKQTQETFESVSLSTTKALSLTLSRGAGEGIKHAKTSATKVLLKQFAYFGIPMSVLTIAATTLWNDPANGLTVGSYVDHMYRAQELSTQGHNDEAIAEAREAFAAMQAQIPLLKKRTELQPTAAREAELAFLIYNESLYENLVMRNVDGQPIGEQQTLQHREHVREAVRLMSQAIDSGEPLAHSARSNLTAEQARQVLASWRKQLG